MTLRRQARIANMARAFEQRTIVPLGRSCRRWRSSSRSGTWFGEYRREIGYTGGGCGTFDVEYRVFGHGLRDQLQSHPHTRALVVVLGSKGRSFFDLVEFEPIPFQHVHVFDCEHLVGGGQLQQPWSMSTTIKIKKDHIKREDRRTERASETQ